VGLGLGLAGQQHLVRDAADEVLWQVVLPLRAEEAKLEVAAETGRGGEAVEQQQRAEQGRASRRP
jgi:hypothetical protein